MPASLRTMIRIRVIDQCLQRKHLRWSWEMLAEECARQLADDFGIHRTPSRSLILHDINLMRYGKLGYYAPIRFDRVRNGYYYTDPDFSISQIPVSAAEFDRLRHAALLLRQFRGFNTINGLEEILARLEAATGAMSKSHQPREVIQLDRPLQKAGERWIDRLYHSIQSQTALSISYKPFYEPEPLAYTVSPYLLREYNRRWFLIGFNHKEQKVYTFPLDRIVTAVPAQTSYIESPSFSPEYYHQVVGVSIPDENTIEDVLIAATPIEARYIETKPIHRSQKHAGQMDDGRILFSYRLIPNIELENVLLSRGEWIEVLKPLSLRERLKTRLLEAAQAYLKE